MADHIDKQIRTAAAASLTGLTTTGSRVFPSRAYPMQDGDVPGLRVYVDDTEIDVIGIGNPATQERDIELVVEFCGKASANYDDEADASKKEVEIAIANNNTLGGAVGNTRLTRIETDRDPSPERVVMVTRLVFICRTYTASNAPDVPL